MDKIFKIAKKVRRRTEKWGSPETECMKFSRELCKELNKKGVDCKVIVGQYRHPCLIGRRDVFGDYHKGHLWAHSWAETKTAIVDITGDQFNDSIIGECDEEPIEPIQIIEKGSDDAKRYKKPRKR